MKGYKRCKCRENGRELGAQCPKLRRANGTWNPNHGTWYGKTDLAPAPDGSRITLRAGGFDTQDDMAAWFADAVRLAEIPEPGTAGHRDRMEILELIRESRKRKEPLPDYDDLRRRYRHGAGFSAGTTGEYLLRWIKEHEDAGDLRKSTLKGYRSHIVHRFLPAFGDIPLDKLRAGHVARVFDAIDNENTRIAAARASQDPAVRASVRGKRITGPATKQRIRATLRSALADAASGARPLITVNVATLIRLAPGKRPKARVWTAERESVWRAGYEQRAAGLTRARDRFEAWRDPAHKPSPVMVWTPVHLGRFLDHVASDRLYPLWHLMAYRGLRRGEACGLRWIDVDLDAGTLEVQRQLVQLGWEVEESEPKTDASDATVALDKQTVKVLRAWRKVQLRERLEWGEAWQDTGRVFTRENGAELHPAEVTLAFEHHAYDAGLPPVRLHDKRHGTATLLLAAGAEMKEVQATLRHSSLAITADTYTSVLPEVASAAAEKVAKIVPRATKGRRQTAAERRAAEAHRRISPGDRLRVVPGEGVSETGGLPSVPHQGEAGESDSAAEA